MNTFKAVKYFATRKPNFGREVVVVAAKRTPIGMLLGKLSKQSATSLSSETIKAALTEANLTAQDVDSVILGNVISAGLGQAPARQAAIGAGLPVNVTCTTVNKVCASGMKSLAFAAQDIGMGLSDVVVAGGFESMSKVPFYLLNHRKGHTFGNEQLIDGVAYDGLTDVYNGIAMGLCAEKTSSDLKIERAVQDEFCIASYERTNAAMKDGRFKNEIVPIKISDKETVSEDEEPKKFLKEKIPLLKPVFSKTGTITAANASKINDGAATFILMSADKAKEKGLKPLARIVSYADAETDPIDFCIAPTPAIQKALQYAGKKITDIDYFEINEAFAATVLANMKLLDLDHERVNVNGGAVALGHPIGMSGARIVQSLISVLKQKGARFGIASICNGGGGASAMLIENLQ
eukprot:CAMPEP_0176445886 /NCGR_PEP_ID=MMETSP0127-20121128/23984_1 /TAXON_ID=938130 /ORGANISM="Platyophrya macrostoma, Strain WH" /LENGTH=406 /DNA_ID=CAMNT_0017831789 /DNA_START=21 /DNA_END=1241 /DNA_ORIENTATION=+